jgi:S1-C subfamily serine protease
MRSGDRLKRVERAIVAVLLAVAVALGAVAVIGGGEEGGGGGGRPGGGEAGRTTAREQPPEPTAPVRVRHAVIARARSGTVYIRSGSFNRTVAGSGVLLDARRGLVLTNFHVVVLGSGIEAGSPRRVEAAQILAAAPCEDLALLRVPGLRGRRPIRLGRQRDVELGAPVAALGYPARRAGRKSATTTRGVVSAPRTALRLRPPDARRYTNLVRTSAALAPGDSGGPLVGAHGRLVGVNTIVVPGGASGRPRQGYAIGVDRVRAVLRDLRRGRSRGWFGAGLVTPSRRFVRDERLPAGLFVTGAQGGTSAAALGIEGVLLTSVDGHPVGRSLARYCRAMRGHRSGETVELGVVRTAGGAVQAIRATLP